MKNISHVHRLVLAALIGIVAIPTAMTGFQLSPYEIRERAVEDVQRVRNTRRDYWDAIEVYNELVRLGVENLVIPDLNDPDSIARYLDGRAKETIHGSASESTVSEAEEEYRLLNPNDRNVLEGYLSTSRCPLALLHHRVQGIYSLCVSLLSERADSVREHLQTRSSHLRGEKPSSYTPLRRLNENTYVPEEPLHPRTHTLDMFRPSLRRD